MTRQPSHAERMQELQAFWANECMLAREDPNRFMELCFRDDQTGGNPPFRQQWFHKEWQSIWRTTSISVIHGATGFGKSDQVIGHILWRLGNDPSLRVTIIGKQQGNASKLLQKIKRQIEENQTLRSIFPSLKPGEPWSTEKLRLSTAGLDTTTNNVEVYGLDGSPQGVRGDFILLDDVIDGDNTRTEEQRQKVIDFVDTTAQSRLTTTGQLHIVANAWHPADLAFTYAKRPGIFYRAYPAEHPLTHEPVWPAFRPKAWLDKKKASMTPRKYAAMFLCVPGNDESRLFEQAWFDNARKLGAGLKPMREVKHTISRDGRLTSNDAIFNIGAAFASRLRIVIGVDLATGVKAAQRKSDLTVFFVVAITPDGHRQVLWVESGRWNAPTILQKMVEYESRYQPDRFVVESNAAQVFLTQFAQHVGGFQARIDNFVTTAKKWDEDLGIEGIGTEMMAGRWLFPGPAAGEHIDRYTARLTPEERDAYAAIEQSATHLLDFQRAGHTPDDVMAMYFAKEGVLRCLTGTFSHRNANGPEQKAREQAGMAGTVAALTPERAQVEVPAHIRAQFGL